MYTSPVTNPDLLALFSFFNAETALRGADFLWSHDLAAYDAPIKFGFNFPILGGHLSLFNVMACITSFMISWYSMSMTPDQSNPVLKYMPYIFPVFLLFFFNNLPSGLDLVLYRIQPGDTGAAVCDPELYHQS